MDSLEGWVAVKDSPFADSLIPPKMTFLVAWNDIEKRIAVTCRLRSRTVADTEDCQTRTRLFSFSELDGIHNILCLIYPSLAPFLPKLPADPQGLWAYVTSPETPENIDCLCEQLQHYFSIALEVCHERLIMSTLFEEFDENHYYENISEYRRRAFEENIQRYEEELENIQFERNLSTTMKDLQEVYLQEDEAVFKLNISLAELYNYQLQPFLDLREAAKSKLKEAKQQLQNPNIGARVKREYADMFSEWQQHHQQALDTIQELYIKYYTHTVNIYKGL